MTIAREHRTLRRVFRGFAGDEAGAVMTEYIVMVTFLIVGFIWLNKSVDTLMFGASPYGRTGDPNQTEALNDPSPTGSYGGQPERRLEDFEGLTEKSLKGIGGDSPQVQPAHPDRAYLAQLYISLCRP